MRQVLLFLLLVCVGTATVQAQPVFTPRNIALGGGGSTYITDYNANFYNPANLMIQDRRGDFAFGVGIGSFYMKATQNYSNLSEQLENSQNYISPFKSSASPLSSAERSEILEDNYPAKTTLSDQRMRYDVTLLGMKWSRDSRAFSIAVRTRTSSSFGVGKGWYTNAFQENNEGQSVLNRSLVQRYQSLHEVSFGYAESFQFLSGLTPRIDNFVIGIAPKLVMGGSYQSAVWNNVYEGGSTLSRTQNFVYHATGEFGAATKAYLDGTSVGAANQRNFSDTEFSIDGIGAGLDIGVTYLITLGSDLSAVRPSQQPTQRSLRLSFSMTDIGFISYNSDEISLAYSSESISGVTAPTSVSSEAFTGARGQYLPFIQQFGEDNPFQAALPDRSSFSTLLPMAMHGGALLEINRLKLMGDVSVGLTNNAFNSTKLVSAFGIELRPLKFLPLRGGIRFKAQRPEFFSLGTAIETKKWDLSLAAQFTPNSLTNQPQVTGLSVATFQFHF
jgi:hypothetical protein